MYRYRRSVNMWYGKRGLTDHEKQSRHRNLQLETVKAFKGSALLTDSGEPKHTVYRIRNYIRGTYEQKPLKNPIGILVIQSQPKMVGTFEVDILDVVDISRQSTFGQRNNDPARIGIGTLSFNVNRKWWYVLSGHS